MLKVITMVSAAVVISLAVVAFTLFKPATPTDIRTDFSEATSISLLAVGDQGVGNLRQWQVANAMENVASEMQTDAVLLLGDNFYGDGVESVDDLQWRFKFENVYLGALSAVPFFATLGNHDYFGNAAAQIDYDKSNLGSGRWQMPARDYVRTFGKDQGQSLLRIAFVDSGEYQRDPAEAVAQLDKLLSDTPPATWTLVATHMPLVSGNISDLPAGSVEAWKPVLAKHQVALVLSGHDHNMQLIERPDLPTTVILGVGGKHEQTLDNEAVAGLQFYAAELGFGALQVESARMSLQYINTAEKVLHQYEMARLSSL